MRYSKTLRKTTGSVTLETLLVALAAGFVILLSGHTLAQSENPAHTPPASPASSDSDTGTVRSALTDSEIGWGMMSAEQRERAIRYSSTRHTFYFVDFAYSAVILLVLLLSGISAKMWNWAERMGKRRFPALFLYVVMFLIVMTLAFLPLSYYLGFHLEHQYGLSNQTLGAWLTYGLISLGVLAVLVTIVVAIFYALVRAYPRTWWAWLGVVAVPLLVILIVLSPVVITPLFYKTTPMEESSLRAQILDLAEQSGIPDSRVFVMDASKNTKKLNAYVTGLGQTKRIVLFDNLINGMTAPEVLFVLGHEMAHYLLHHVWIALAIAVASVFVFGFLSHLILGTVIAANRSRFGFDQLATPASLPLVVLCFSVCGFLFHRSKTASGGNSNTRLMYSVSTRPVTGRRPRRRSRKWRPLTYPIRTPPHSSSSGFTITRR